MTSPSDPRGISDLLGDAFAQLAKLFRNEIDLARAELSDKISKVGNAGALIGAGAILMIPALVLMLPWRCWSAMGSRRRWRICARAAAA